MWQVPSRQQQLAQEPCHWSTAARAHHRRLARPQGQPLPVLGHLAQQQQGRRRRAQHPQPLRPRYLRPRYLRPQPLRPQPLRPQHLTKERARQPEPQEP